MKKDFATKELFFKYLKDNKSILLAEKKATIKYADAVSYGCLSNLGVTKTGVTKGLSEIDAPELDKLKATIVINTTNLMDSHDDVHIQGLWKKTLSEQKTFYHIQEHCLKFENVISDEVIAYTKSFNWSDFNQSFTGKTEALIFESTISEDRNEYMFEQYLKGRVKQHSVGMRYVQLFMCINSDEKYYAEEKANWDKYITQVANIDEVNEQGFFWAVTEAKLVEGSAVVLGSNPITPTISITEIVPSEDTQNKTEPIKSLDKQLLKNELEKQFKNLKFN